MNLKNVDTWIIVAAGLAAGAMAAALYWKRFGGPKVDPNLALLAALPPDMAGQGPF